MKINDNDPFSPAASEMHACRREALAAAVDSVLHERCVTVTGIGRGMRSQAREKHCIKRADRLLSNRHLHAEAPGVYALMCQWLVGGQKHPVIVIDWSGLDAQKRHQLLRAAMVVAGRALSLYEEVHTAATALKPATERGFLRRLQGMLPPGCQPVLVTDAGFRTPWFKAVERMQWYWVARIRHRHFVQFPGQTWHSCKRLHGKASERPRCLGEALLTQTRAHRCTLVLYRGPAQGRHCFNAHGERAQRGQKYARSAREPWLLATNLPRTRALAQKVVRLYRARMQIEEAFRDLKSARFGLALGYQRTGKADRLAMLLLIAALAMMVLWLIGMVARQRNLSRHYQANTERRRGVLSVIFLAMRVIDRGGQTFTMAQLASAWRCIQDLNAACWGSES